MNTATEPSTGTGTSVAGLSGRQAVALVARREFTTRGRSKVNLIVSILMLVGIVVLVVVMKLTSGASAPPVSSIGFVGSSASTRATFAAVAQTAGQHTRTVVVPDQASGQREVRAGTLDALVTGPASDLRVVVRKSLSDQLTSVFTLTARQLVLSQRIAAAGGDPTAIESAVAGTSVHVSALEPVHNDARQTQRLVFGIIAAVLVYLALILYGQTVAHGVVEEKSSRIVEVLLSAIRPWHLMLGKVIGIGSLGLLQFLVITVAGVGAAMGTHVLTISTSALGGMAAWVLVWFLAGFAMYALLFAAAGALVSRQEDAPSVVSPLILLIVGSYVLGVSVLPAHPHTGYLAVMSVIPLFSPTLMPMRIALGAPAWEAWLALGLTIVLTVALVGVTGRIYSNAVLHMGTRMRLRAALRAHA